MLMFDSCSVLGQLLFLHDFRMLAVNIPFLTHPSISCFDSLMEILISLLSCMNNNPENRVSSFMGMFFIFYIYLYIYTHTHVTFMDF